ncbi:unnamed protein product [Mycena citricolor]|uniref:Uncharacterized protein n=1 Tax=Mycena citricolor TaxID=2018698 RepID=A0AAD2H5A1_9AGAR|nr:unnamed protein product [Mycena citricolor]
MPFPFTFKFAVPGLNPFATQEPQPVPVASSSSGPFRPPTSPARHRDRHTRPQTIPDRTSSSRSPSASAPISRKRGWDPSLAEPSLSTTTLTSGSGYLDTPAKYREMAISSRRGDDSEVTEMAMSVPDLPPPAKRRRGLAGSIVSTAVSAALIGTAVGLTVYRLWRDRGKDAEQKDDSRESEQPPPPPPYQQGGWTPAQASHAIHVTPPTPMATPRRRKVHHGHASRRAARARSRAHAHSTISPPPSVDPSQPQRDVEMEEEPSVVEEQMDWLGGQLAALIQEGQKALGREIVVQSEAQEDEIDDGTGVWEEEEGGFHSEFGGLPNRTSSPRRKRQPRNLTLVPSSHSSRPNSASPRTQRFDFVSASLPSSAGSRGWPQTPDFGRSMSAESDLSRSLSTRETESSWDSPELRETMARARARALANQAAG